jgi:D-sedoheptulose 7-phosphate isomerase
MINFADHFLKKVEAACKYIDRDKINIIANNLKKLRSKSGRLFFLGVGGSAGNCSHAVNDFRKLCNIEAYAPTDNISELTARTNDEGWETIFVEWLKVSNFNIRDAIFIFSVGGGNKKKKVSQNLIHAIDFVKKKRGKIFSIVGRSDGYAFKKSDISILIKSSDKNLITPISESFQAIIWHLIVSHPELKRNKTKW